MAELRIIGASRYTNGLFAVNGVQRAVGSGEVDADLALAWATTGSSYDRFHRMDRLSRLVLVCCEELVLRSAIDRVEAKERMGMVLMGEHGSFETDRLYHEGMKNDDLAAPGLFVRTLPNIAIGELSIRHGFHGSGLCLIGDRPDMRRLRTACTMMLQQEGMRWVLCVWADIFAQGVSATCCLVGTEEGELWNMTNAEDISDEQH